MVDALNFPEVVRKKEFENHTAAVVKCPSGCGGEILIGEQDLSAEKGVKGSARCEECSDMVRYTSPKDGTGFEKLEMK